MRERPSLKLKDVERVEQHPDTGQEAWVFHYEGNYVETVHDRDHAIAYSYQHYTHPLQGDFYHAH